VGCSVAPLPSGPLAPDLGGGRPPRELQPGERCSGSSIVQGPLTVRDQSELEQLAGCEQIDGDLHIEVFEGADLRPLSALRVVDGLLELGAYPDIALENNADLMAIKAQVERIAEDGYLSSLTGLEGLQRASALQINYVAAEDLEPLLGLRQLSGRGSPPLPAGSLGIESTANLRDLRGLANIESVGRLLLTDNPALSSLGGIQLAVNPINISLVDSPLLGSLDELEGVGSTGSLTLSNLGITEVDSLESLYFVDYSLSLLDNSQLQNIDGLANLSSAGSFEVTGNAVLESIPPLRQIFLLDDVRVTDNPGLKSIRIDLPSYGDGYNLQNSRVKRPIQLVDIGRNDSLTEISLSSGLETGRLLAIYENPALTHVSIGTLRRLEELDINTNATLERVDVGLLKTVDTLSLLDNPKLDAAQLGAIRTFASVVGGNGTAPAGSP
jgi:hypothetical protein